MKQGQPVNISKVECLAKMPAEMVKDRSMSFATKAVYSLLVKHSGSIGYCSVFQQKLAEEMGVSIVLIRKAISALRKGKYIMIVQGYYHKPNRYYFLWRDEFKIKKGFSQLSTLDPELHTRIIQEAAEVAKDEAKS